MQIHQTKIPYRGYAGCAAFLLLLIVMIAVSGCTSSPDSGQTGNVGENVTATATVTVTPSSAPVTTVTIAAVAAITTGTASLTYSNSAYGFSMNYPADWQKDEPVQKLGLRDYGQYTYNIVNFYSPDEADGSYRTFSVDVDPTAAPELENYFNLATIALGKVYTPLDITKHDYQLKISGDKAYRLDFKAPNKDPTIEIFTLADNNIPYIVTYNAVDDSEFQAMIKSIRITPVTTGTKSR